MTESFSNKKLSLKDILLSRIRRWGSKTSSPRYREVYLDADSDYPLPRKEIYKGEELLSQTYLAVPLLPKTFLESEYTPSFAQGRCQIIGGGDYKTVIADQNGNSDTVIKLYHWHAYRGPDAKIKAETAAKKIKKIHEIANVVAPGYLLPSRFGIEYKNGYYRVIEIQQRAEWIPFSFFDPETYERLEVESHDLLFNKTDLVKNELLRLGLSRPHPYLGDSAIGKVTDEFDFTEIHWDLRTNHVVSLDFIDRVDLVPILGSRY